MSSYSQQNLTLPINSVPTHIVVWQEVNKPTNSNAINTDSVLLLEKLTERVGNLETMVKQLVANQQPSTRLRTVSDILGIGSSSVSPSARPLWNSPMMGVNMNLATEDSSEISSIAEPFPKRSPYFTATAVPEPVGLEVLHSAVPSEAQSVDEKEAFVEVVNALPKSDKVVSLNGMEFTVYSWNNEVIYCDELGRAFLNPQDAFSDSEKYIGFWNSSTKTLDPRTKLSVEQESIHSEEKGQLDEKEVKAEEAEEEQAEEEEEEEAEEEEAEEEEAEEEEAEEEEAEEEAMELQEFEYKGETYYKDADNQVYQMNSDGDLDETPIGVWNEQKQKVLRYPKN